MNYESDIHNLFVDVEIHKEMLEEVQNQYEINFMIRFGSLLSRIKLDYGTNGLKNVSKYIKKELGITYEVYKLKKFLKLFNLISKGMIISYRLTIFHYFSLSKFNDIDFINNCIATIEKNHLTSDEFADMLNILQTDQ